MKFTETYKDIMSDLQPSPELQDRLQIRQEAKSMRFTKKKALIVAAAACMLIGTTVFASGKIASYRSWSGPNDEIASYEDAVSKSGEVGSTLTIPEAFSNGYTYDSANTMGFQGLDENGNVIVNGTELCARYVKDSMPEISLFVNKSYEDEGEIYSVDERVIGDTTVYLNETTYKFVPEGYEITEEDEENMKDPHFEMSYGSSEVEIKNNSGISFNKDGIHYNMFAWDADLSADEWYEMAAELIANK